MKKANIILLILIFLVVSCGGSNSKKLSLPDPKVEVSENEIGWQKDKREVTFDWYINFSWFGGKWGEDIVTQNIAEKTGVKINYIIPTGDGTEKLNTMIASNTLPDIITLEANSSLIDQLVKSNNLYALDELANKYDMYFFKVASKNKLDWFKQADGHTYAYPNASYTPEDYSTIKDIKSNNTFLVRKDIYEAIGKPDMSTTEGFLKAMKDAKAKFPEINGQPLIPLGLMEFQNNGDSSLGGYLQDFLAIPLEKDGKLYDRYSDPEYVKWLKAIRQMNQDGLLSPDVFIDKRPQIEEKITQGRYFAMMYPYIDALRPLTDRYSKDQNSAYIAVDGPKNAMKSQHTLIGPGISGWTVTLISKKAKDPEKAIRFLSYLISEEGQRDLYLGKKGVTWDNINGKEQILPEVAKLKEQDRTKFDKTYGIDNLHWMLMDNAMQQKKWGITLDAPVKQLTEWTYGKVMPRFEAELIEPAERSEEGIIATKIAIKWYQTLPKLLTAKTEEEFNTLYAQYMKEKETLGISKLMAYRDKKYQENKIKLK